MNILQYESKVWKTADLLLGAGIKQSDFPKFMMPFFALMMVESRILRASDELREEYQNDIQDLIEAVQEKGQGYNEFILKNNKSLIDICSNDKSFDTDFSLYLRSFDPETRNLLGVEKSNEDTKYLNISGIVGQLSKKKILFAFAKGWSEINLKDFNNSEITTLEEHIKRKWADISAETAGEQYTPDDIISLISEIAYLKKQDSTDFLSIYDPTCGGGNMLFGVEDYLNSKGKEYTKTYGQDWNDELYALAKIESRFRDDSTIEYGNTLTDIKFSDKAFEIIVANPPFGVDWKGYKADIDNDQTGRFVALPAISDGQLLFTQHIISQLDIDGIAVVVHNGSTLFSGDAGSGESNIRKHFFDNDYVEAIIQLPTDEFFNTGINSYLWIFNKNKPADKKDKVILINASEKFAPLKKSKGKKRKEITESNRMEIVQILSEFKDIECAKVFDKEYFYFNKQSIMLTNIDHQGKFLELEIKPVVTKITQINPQTSFDPLTSGIIIDTFEIINPTIEQILEAQEKVKALDYKEEDLKVITSDSMYYYDQDKETLIQETYPLTRGQDKVLGVKTELGCGKITIKAVDKKATKTQPRKLIITTVLETDYQKDYEIIPYSRNPETNDKNISEFMAKYITKPFRYLDNTIGVEINFNKVFYKPQQLEPMENILEDLAKLSQQLQTLESSLNI
jgi:type I restriction enzyme M protein